MRQHFGFVDSATYNALVMSFTLAGDVRGYSRPWHDVDDLVVHPVVLGALLWRRLDLHNAPTPSRPMGRGFEHPSEVQSECIPRLRAILSTDVLC